MINQQTQILYKWKTISAYGDLLFKSPEDAIDYVIMHEPNSEALYRKNNGNYELSVLRVSGIGNLYLHPIHVHSFGDVVDEDDN